MFIKLRKLHEKRLGLTIYGNSSKTATRPLRGSRDGHYRLPRINISPTTSACVQVPLKPLRSRYASCEAVSGTWTHTKPLRGLSRSKQPHKPDAMKLPSFCHDTPTSNLLHWIPRIHFTRFPNFHGKPPTLRHHPEHPLLGHQDPTKVFSHRHSVANGSPTSSVDVAQILVEKDENPRKPISNCAVSEMRARLAERYRIPPISAF